MHRHARSLVTLALAPLLAGCDPFGPGDCPTDVRPAIEVAIRSAVTGAYLAREASGWVTDGAYRDSLRLSGGATVSGEMVWMSRSGALERPGTYRVEISAPGYVTWVREGVRVRDAECHVSTVALDARLQPASR